MSIRDAQYVARREVERHHKRYLALTASIPKLQNVNGKLEYVANVRVGQDVNAPLVQNVLVAMQQPGVISDINVPVIVERSPEGLLSITARAQVNLPDIRINTYSYNDLGMLFMAQLTQDSGGTYRDGYGHAMTDPTTITGTEVNYEWLCVLKTPSEIDIDSDEKNAATAEWSEV